MTGKQVNNLGGPGVCCVLNMTVAGPNTTFTSPMPICQSPDDVTLMLGTADIAQDQLPPNTTAANFTKYTYADTGPGSAAYIQYQEPVYPGSCVVRTACRPDALPSVANDILTPASLSQNYRGALDGIVMAFTKYLRCILDNLLGCKNCNYDTGHCDCTQLGIIFYPAILIMSISWQILGGVIRFIASCIIFLFSLFTPPQGSFCGCWENSLQDGFNMTLTQQYGQVGGLCYPCHILGQNCSATPTVSTFVNQPCSKHWYPCAPWCPFSQQQAFPTIDAPTAMANCLAVYNNFTHTNDVINATQACTGFIGNYTVYDIFAAPGLAMPPVDYFNCSTTGSGGAGAAACQPITTAGTNPPFGTAGSGNGLCQFYTPTGFQTDRRLFALIDACPNPSCQYNALPVGPICNQMVSGFWPCGGGYSIFDNSYPDSPLASCGILQIIQNFLDIFTAFGAIFSTPLLISPSTSSKRFEKPSGPVERVPRQEWNKRFAGTVYGLDNSGGTNMFEALVDGLYNYDTSDCYDDPVMCACRNFDIPQHCSVGPMGSLQFGPATTRKRQAEGLPVGMNVNDLSTMMQNEMFTGTSVCDKAIADHAATPEANLTMEQKHRFVSCLDKKIQGSRIQTLADVVPDDIMYNTQAPITLMHNIFHTARTTVQKRFEKAVDDQTSVRAEMERRFPNFKKQLVDRATFARQTLIEKHNIRPEKSIMFDAIIKADRIWYKYQTGWYTFAIEKTMDAILSGRAGSLMPTTKEALTDMRYAAEDLSRIIMNQRYTHLATATYEATSVATRHLAEVMDFGLMPSIRSAFAGRMKIQTRTTRGIHEQSSSRFGKMFYASPLVKWWMDTAKEKRAEALPFVQHLSNIIAFQREHWKTESFNFFNADLKLWSLGEIFTNRFSNPVWTPEKRANYDKLSRLYYQVKERIWPGSVEEGNRERFLFLSNCPIVDRAVNLTTRVVSYCAAER